MLRFAPQHWWETNFTGKPDDFAEVFQAEFGVTRASDPKPVLATFGLGPCIAIGGYDRRSTVGFLAHFDKPKDGLDSFGAIYHILRQYVSPDTARFEVSLVGGQDGCSEGLLAEMKRVIKGSEVYPMDLVREETLGSWDCNRSLALDTRTGQVHAYNPLIKKDRVQRTALDDMLTLQTTIARQVYPPHPPE